MIHNVASGHFQRALNPGPLHCIALGCHPHRITMIAVSWKLEHKKAAEIWICVCGAPEQKWAPFNLTRPK